MCVREFLLQTDNWNERATSSMACYLVLIWSGGVECCVVREEDKSCSADGGQKLFLSAVAHFGCGRVCEGSGVKELLWGSVAKDRSLGGNLRSLWLSQESVTRCVPARGTTHTRAESHTCT